MEKLSLTNPIFATYAIAAALMILKAASMSWLTVARMLQVNGGFRSPEDLRQTPFNQRPDPKQLEPNEAVERMRALLPAAGEPPFVPPFDRIVKMVGNLVGLPMKTVADLPAQLEVMMRRVHATGARSIYAKEQTVS